MDVRNSVVRRRSLQIGLVALTLCAAPGVAEAGEEKAKSGEQIKAPVPGEKLAKLASDARATCRELAEIDPSTLNPNKKTTFPVSLRPPSLAANARKEALEKVKDAVVDTRSQCASYCSVEGPGGTGTASVIDACKLESPTLAAASVLVAPNEASKAGEELQRIVGKIEQIKQAARGEKAALHGCLV